MSRRRKGNKLIGRILLISFGAHVIALPVLARFGAFDKIRREFATSTVMVLPPAPPDKEKPPVKKAETKKLVTKAKGPSQSHAAQAHSSLSHPAVVASNAPAGSGGDDGPAIDPNGAGKAGVLPTPAGGGAPSSTGNGNDNGSASTTTPPQPEPKPTPPPPTPSPSPSPKPEPPTTPKPEPIAPRPHTPTLTEAEPSYQPQPTIPDDLRTEALDKTCVIEVRVSTDGSASGAKIAQSSGVDELDQLAIESAKKWRFKAATRDGEPVASLVRLHVQFRVD